MAYPYRSAMSRVAMVTPPEDIGENPADRQRANVASVYNEAGAGYGAYADGDMTGLFAFEGMHSYADRCVWATLDALLVRLKEAGRTSISILDAGSGPGTWLRRLITRAHALGFARIDAHGFDISRVQINRAKRLARPLANLPNVTVDFGVADLTQALPYNNGQFDLTICLYSVLSHLPVARMPGVAAELARVTCGRFVTTVRPLNSPPSVFVEPIENARYFKRDSARDVCSVELMDGRRFELTMHLFSARELQSYFWGYFDIELFRGLDLFHSRFAGDVRWNGQADRGAQEALSQRLAWLENLYSANPDFIERAAHMLLVGQRKSGQAGRSVAAPTTPT